MGLLTVAVVGPLYFLFLRCRGYRLRDLDATRRHWAELRRRHPGPWLICGNHLTLIDSMLLTYGLMSLSSHFKEFRALPWNLPERANFQKQLWKGLLCYLAKCIPVSRGGDREEMQTTLGKCNWVLQNNRVLMIFPEGGRSRAGRIDQENFSYGIGRFLQDHPSCRVLCVYLRGDRQDAYSDLPARGESFTISIDVFEPRRPVKEGLRGQRELAGQIVSHLAQMEEEYFAGRRQRHCGFDRSVQPGKASGPALSRPGLHGSGRTAD
jgi:hypothetical protein